MHTVRMLAALQASLPGNHTMLHTSSLFMFSLTERFMKPNIFHQGTDYFYCQMFSREKKKNLENLGTSTLEGCVSFRTKYFVTDVESSLIQH